MTNKILNHKKQHAFTLVEFIVVIITVSLIALFASSRWIGNSPNLYAQTQQLLSDIRYTQNLAMTQGVNYYLELTTPNSYSIIDENGNTIPSPSTGANSVSFNSNISYGSITQLPHSLIGFDGLGIPYTSSDFTTTLNTTATIELTSNGQNHTISITPGTGWAAMQ